MEDEESELLGGTGAGISVSLFDHSVENYFKALDTISKLCGEVEPDMTDSLNEAEIQRLSSSITFLREWRHYNYKPRVLRFASENGRAEDLDVLRGIHLPQFSSATVPKKEGLHAGATFAEPSKDFVLYVGGSVWALDWCPRDHERFGSDMKCEFVAVAAHPPESDYHKMGTVLTGRGVIQIWCILNASGNKEEEPIRMKRQKMVAEHNEGDNAEFKRPRGRPRKKPVESSSVGEATNDVMKRPRGRPRKKQTENSPSDEGTKDITEIKGPRGTHRKNPLIESLDSLDRNIQALAVEFPEEQSEMVTMEKVPMNTKEQVREIDKGKEGESTSKPVPACVSSGKTVVYTRRLKNKAKQSSNIEDKTCPPPLTHSNSEGATCVPLLNHGNSDNAKCPPLLTENEEESSAMDHQIPKNPRKDPGSVKCASDSVSLDTNSASSLIPNDVALPRVVLCLAHNGKVAWDVKWRPNNHSDSKCQHRMGYLAVLLGNGSLEVWDVPLPHTVKFIYSSSSSIRSEGTDPRFVKLEPVFQSNLKSGEMQSVPMIVEWSTSRFHDYLLAGCHDGMVALWKFSTSGTSGDTRPLLCFSADTNPIRAVAWAPFESDEESSNIILTAGQVNIKFWDIRDPFRPLWDIHSAPKFIYSVDWTSDPRCIIFSCEDGALRLFSLAKALYDSPVAGKPSAGTKLGMHSFNCSSSAIWDVKISRLTGMVAYCSADGTVHRFQSTRSVEKDPKRSRVPHFMCGALGEDDSTITVITPSPGIPVNSKKLGKDTGENLRSIQGLPSMSNQDKTTKGKANVSDPDDRILALCYGNDPGVEPKEDETLASLISKSKRKSQKSSTEKGGEDQALILRDAEEQENVEKETEREEAGNEVEMFPPKAVAMHRVRWNMNKGSQRWLCSGGAAGIVRCQEIIMSDIDWKLARKRKNREML